MASKSGKKKKTSKKRLLMVGIVPDRSATIRNTVNAVLMHETGLGPDYTKTMGGYYMLTSDKIGIFMRTVSDEMPAPYKFDWQSVSPTDASAATLAGFDGLVGQFTDP